MPLPRHNLTIKLQLLMNPTSHTPTNELRKVELKFTRYGLHRRGNFCAPLWRAAAVLTYLSPAVPKQKVDLPSLRLLSTTEKRRLELHFCPGFFIISSPDGRHHFYTPQGKHTAAIPAAEAGTFDTFSVDSAVTPLRFIGATFRKGNEMRLFSPKGKLLSHSPATEEE